MSSKVIYHNRHTDKVICILNIVWQAKKGVGVGERRDVKDFLKKNAGSLEREKVLKDA